LRLLLDAHLSGRVIGKALRNAGHDILTIDEHRGLDALEDALVLQLAAQEQRILVTSNVRDFPDLLQQWAGERRSHAGCIILVGCAQNEFGVILRLLTKIIAAKPDQSEWQDLAMFLGPSSPTDPEGQAPSSR
jgi:predicted nuclease of predicted toxin-antitoxin system